jgi:hypothetical protein
MDEERATTELREVFTRWLAAIPARDTAFFEATLDDGWHYTDYRGHVHDKADYLRQVGTLIQSTHRTGLVEFYSRALSDEIVGAFGRYTSVGTMNNGSQVEQDSRFSAVWKLTDGSWKALVHQATNVGEPLS